jgi:RND family efflux transporter MFP subunit
MTTESTTLSPGIELRPLSGWTVLLLGVAATALLLGLFVLGWLPQQARERAAAASASAAMQARPTVQLLTPHRAPAAIDLKLPADLRPNQATSIYARATGFLKPLPAGIDLGARVHAGQLLAEIDAPDLDADLVRAAAACALAEATLARARDDLDFQKASFERYQGFATTGGLTTQQLEERRQQLNMSTTGQQIAEANVHTAKAEQQRLTELQSFERVVAPFDGVLTYRGVDAGALIAPPSNGVGKELFKIAATDVLRVRVSVPQSAAGEVRVGQQAELVVRNLPGRVFQGAVARTAGAIDPDTRMLAVDVDVANADGALVAGAYGQVRLHVVRQQPPWMVPTGAIMFGAEGMRVAVVVDERIHWKPLHVEADHGAEAEIADGLDGDEKIVGSPSVSLTEGTVVEVRAAGAKEVGR